MADLDYPLIRITGDATIEGTIAVTLDPNRPLKYPLIKVDSKLTLSGKIVITLGSMLTSTVRNYSFLIW